MEYHLVESDKYSIKIYPSISYLEYRLKPGVIIDVEDVLRGKKEVTRLCPNQKFFVLAESEEFFRVTRDARKVTSTFEYSDNTRCIAFYTKNFSVAMLGELYNKINKPAIPTKMFSNRDSAKEWLWKQMKIPSSFQKQNDLQEQDE